MLLTDVKENWRQSCTQNLKFIMFLLGLSWNLYVQFPEIELHRLYDKEYKVNQKLKF